MADLLQGTWVFDKINRVSSGGSVPHGYATWFFNFVSNGVNFTSMTIGSEDLPETYASSSTYSIFYGGDFSSYFIQPGYAIDTNLNTITIASTYDEVEDAANLVRALTARATFYPITNDIEVPMKSSKGVRLLTGGKLCDKDILVTPDFEIYEKPNIQPLTITENGTYPAPDGVDGYSPVTVAVAASGGGSDFEKYFEDQYREVSLPNVTQIKRHAFFKDDKLKIISMPQVKRILAYAFQDCTLLSLTELPSGLEEIQAYAFYGCYSLALSELPSGVTSIGLYAFQNCSKLALTALPRGMTEIASYSFKSCTSIQLTELPDGITKIGTEGFRSCTSLTSIILPSALTTVSGKAFYSCTNLSSVTFRSTPTSINSDVFTNCTNLTTINVPWAEGAVANAPWGATKATINYNYTGG
jgi:hypothetical protein